MKETVKLHQLSTSLQVNLEVCLKEFWKCVLLNHAPVSTKLHPPPPCSFEPPPSSLQHSQQYSNQNVACNWAIFPNLDRNIQSCPFSLKIGSHVILQVSIPNPDFGFQNFNPKIHFERSFGSKIQSCPFCLKIGTHCISRMLILIPTLILWNSDSKIDF